MIEATRPTAAFDGWTVIESRLQLDRDRYGIGELHAGEVSHVTHTLYGVESPQPGARGILMTE